jgi:hypothetical protein
MKSQISILLMLALLACQTSQTQDATSEWIRLFNGTDMSGWTPKITGYALGDNFANTFRVEGGNLKVAYDGYTEFQEKFGHLFYKDKYSWYVLSLEYRFVGEQAPGGPEWAIRNSGAMLHCQNPASMLINQDFPISIEVQLLGGNGKDERSTANLCTPGTNVVINGKLFTNHCIDSSSKTYHGDQWVSVEVLVLGDSLMEHFVDGKSVLKYEKPQIGDGNVSNFNPSVKKDGLPLKEGYISLQSESHPVEFRKVELLDLAKYAGNQRALEDILRKLKLR